MNAMNGVGAAMAVSTNAIGLSAPSGATARWSEQRTEHLCSLLREDKTFSDIAIAMDVSRSAIAGQVDRMRCRQDPRLPAIAPVGRPAPVATPAPSAPADRRVPMPDDFAALAATMTNQQLAEHYGCGRGFIARWRKECGVAGKDGSFKPLPIPDNFAVLAPTLTPYQAALTFGHGVEVMKRWAAATGVRLRSPALYRTRGNTPPTQIESKRDMTRAGRAAEFLQRISYVYRCDAKGAPDKNGKFWRRGSFVLTDAEIIDRAERNGWDEHAWRRCAA